MELWRILTAFLLTLLCLNPVGSDWLTCATITYCHCKWSSGKKTASCVSASLSKIPGLASEIQVLDLHGNNLEKLDEDAFASIHLLNLQRLNLSLTSLKTIHSNAFRELSILIELDLSQNELTRIQPETFKDNERLRLLVLSDNPLINLIAEQFPVLQHLKKLELSRCKLQNIHPFAFVNLRSLETVYMHQNHLTYLHQNTFNLPVLKTLTLSNNPWYCDCRLKFFYEWFKKGNLASEDIFCDSPEDKKGISWREISKNDMVCPPTALSSPTVIRTEIGADITFGCFVRGDPKPDVNWYFNDEKINNYTLNNVNVQIHHMKYFDPYKDDVVNKSAQWINVTIFNVTNEYSGEWKCYAKSSAGDVKAYLTLVLPKARTATAKIAPVYSPLLLTVGSMFSLAILGLVATCICWKSKRINVPESRSFTDQEKKLLDNSLAVSFDRTSASLGSSYGFEMLDRSLSIESEDTQKCYEPVQITIEGVSGSFPPPPAEFALQAPYGNIFISVQVTGHGEKYPDLLGGGATLPRRSRTCFLRSANDNMGPRITAAGSSTWSLPDSNNDIKNIDKESFTTPLSTFSTEFTAL